MKNNVKNRKKSYFRTAIVSSLMLISMLSLATAGFVYFSTKNKTIQNSSTPAKDCSKLLSTGKYEELYNYLEGVSDITQSFNNVSDQKKYSEFIKIYSNYSCLSQESEHLSRCTYYGEFEIYLKWSMYYASMAANLAQGVIHDGDITGSKSAFNDILNRIKTQLKEKCMLTDSQIAEIIAINNDDADFFTALASKYLIELKPKLSLKEFENAS